MSAEDRPVCHGMGSRSGTGQCGVKPSSIGKAWARSHPYPPVPVLSVVERWLHLQVSRHEKPTLRWAEGPWLRVGALGGAILLV